MAGEKTAQCERAGRMFPYSLILIYYLLRLGPKAGLFHCTCIYYSYSEKYILYHVVSTKIYREM